MDQNGWVQFRWPLYLLLGQESLRRNGAAIIVNKRVWNAVLECNLKNDRMISVPFQGKPFNIMVIQVYAQPVMLKKLKLNGSMKTYKTFRTNTQKRCPFHYRGLECKSRKSRNTSRNRQIWPWSTEWSREKANRVLPRELTGHSKTSSSNTREDSTHGHHQMVNTKIRLIIFFAAKDGQILYIQQKQDRELTVAQIINSLL